MPQYNIVARETGKPDQVSERTLARLPDELVLKNPDLSAVEGVDEKYWKVVGDQVVEMTAEEKAVADAAPLGNAKLVRTMQVDEKTPKLIEAGFTYASKAFSLSENAQRNWSRLMVRSQLGTLIYPVRISTTDSNIEHSLADAAEVQAFFETLDDAIQAHLQSGRDLKVRIQTAATQGALDGVTDDRS